ncbi:hypothetical protein [Cellulophaga sp. L1A9]|uniref:hypothetical protein n=1 Tax=Cellulophaga sp. L1A9 TaxID=2686362 RepID=UPI00131B361F|nr:hypothetical protein [Cellulophaga sp. L1A9]
MKQLLVFVFLAIYSIGGHSQEKAVNLEKGTVLVLLNPRGENYKHLDFPRKNHIIKRGAIADFNSLVGLKLIIEDFKEVKNKKQVTTLIRQDGKPFFRFFNSVNADLEEAIENGELKLYSE